MKIGKRLREVLGVLEDCGVLERSVLVSRVGFPEQRLETDLRRLKESGAETEYLAVILVQAG
jgi:precorrin-2/cobalt-factor-2 C20-methyltransferase